jgi:hypothetical protein
MLLRALALASASVAAASSFCVLFAGGVLGLSRMKLLGGPAGVLVLGASLVVSVIVFRATHDGVVLRWSNEPKPFLYGRWRPPPVI